MTKTQSLFFRALLFFAGAGVLALAFFLFTAGKELTQSDIFFWISFGIMYLVFWTPFFFSALSIANFHVKIPRLALLWTGIVLYIIASAAAAALLLAQIISLNTAIVAQSVLLFLFGIDVYFAFFASTHIAAVAAEETTKLELITQIKNEARMCALAVQNLPSQYQSEQKILLQTFEDIKYISPARGAEDLEARIISALSRAAELCAAAQAGGSPIGFDVAARDLQTLVKQRKLLRN